MSKRKKLRKWKEYSKIIIKFMIMLWFIVALFGMTVSVIQLIISPEYINLEALYDYVGVPMTGGIIAYLIKSAMENKAKIQKNNSDFLDINSISNESADENIDL